MYATIIVVFVNLFATVFYFLLLARVVMSWFADSANVLYAWLVNVTEPLLAPIRQLLPKQGPIDFAPLIAFVALRVLQMVVAAIFVV